MNGYAVSLKEFLLTEQRCPPEWRPFDLYLFRDDEVVFYVGQSYVAFDRVWRHILDGYKGRSVVGRFIHCNWPASLPWPWMVMMDSTSSGLPRVCAHPKWK